MIKVWKNNVSVFVLRLPPKAYDKQRVFMIFANSGGVQIALAFQRRRIRIRTSIGKHCVFLIAASNESDLHEAC